jgi:hypothetical protein
MGRFLRSPTLEKRSHSFVKVTVVFQNRKIYYTREFDFVNVSGVDHV